MAHLLRGKQAGIQDDLSAGITPGAFLIDDVSCPERLHGLPSNLLQINRYGINSQISQIAYDPLQSLLVVGTNDTKFGRGQIYVFGRKRISVVLPLPRKASVKILQISAEKLICLDSRNDLSIFSLEAKCLVASYSVPGVVTSICSDPTLDYALLGMQNGAVHGS